MTKTGRILIVSALVLAASALVGTRAILRAADSPCDKECRGNIDWSIGNTGAPDCPDQYVATEPKCLAEGNRSCLMRRAIDSAKHNNDSYAKRLTLITQCHNAGCPPTFTSSSAGAHLPGRQVRGRHLFV
jgi:hypothetical protein